VEQLGTIYKGWNAKILICPKFGESAACSVIGDWEEVGCSESVSVDITANLESYYCIGNKEAYAVIPGNLEITGSISKAWIDEFLLQLLIGAHPGGLQTFNLIFRAGTDANAPWIKLTNCRLESGTLDIPQDGWLMEDYDFRAESISVGGSGTAVDYDPPTPEEFRLASLGKDRDKKLAELRLKNRSPCENC